MAAKWGPSCTTACPTNGLAWTVHIDPDVGAKHMDYARPLANCEFTVSYSFVLPHNFRDVCLVRHRYQATAQPFLVFGILTTALAVGHHTF